MSRLANLINETERVVTRAINELEAKNGYPSHDVRQLAENVRQIRQKIADLGLDPDDTTAEELYHALLVRFEKDAAYFDASVGTIQKNFVQRLELTTEITKTAVDLPSQWALKSKAAKNALRRNPPKHVMKHLRYRSLESMLKRESVYEIFLAAQLLEPKTWHKNLAKHISSLDQFDFEMRPVRLVTLDAEKWGDLDGQDYTVFDNHIGAAAILPLAELKDAPLLTMALLQIEELTPNPHLKAGGLMAKVSPILSWWADMDHLVAELDEGYVSLNLKDCALNHWYENDFNEQLTVHGRQSFWQSLVSRYENRPPAEALFDDSAQREINKLKLGIPQPAFEFAEDFDG